MFVVFDSRMSNHIAPIGADVKRKDNCLMLIVFAGWQSGMDVKISISHFRCLFTGGKKAS
jgi:hypothetical protein